MANTQVTPHVLRHTAAMRLLQAGVDLATIALWLGHERIETTYIYLHADLERKQAALDSTAPLDVQPGRYQPTSDILTVLANL
jgi:site-specific recombinase XerD